LLKPENHSTGIGAVNGAVERLVSRDQTAAKLSFESQDGRSRRSDRAVSKWVLRLTRNLTRCLPISLRVLLSYVRNLRQRIADERKIYWDVSDGSPVVPEGLAKEYSSFHGVHKYIRACTQDMTQLRNRYPFLTALELLVAHRSWNDGTRCVENNVCIESGHSRSSASPADDTRPLPEAQQDSIRDLLAQLPSQVLRDELARRDRSCTTQKTESQPLSGSRISSSTHSSDE